MCLRETARQKFPFRCYRASCYRGRAVSRLHSRHSSWQRNGAFTNFTMPPPLSNAEIAEIKSNHGDITRQAKTAFSEAIRNGELLSKARSQLKDGDWGDWIETVLPFSRRTAENYIRVFNNQKLLESDTTFDLSAAYAKLISKKPPKVVNHSESIQPCATVAQHSPANQQVKPKSAAAIYTTPKPAEKETIELDKIGTPIPAKALGVWHRRDEVQAVLSEILALTATVNEVQRHKREDKDVLFAEVPLDDMAALMRRLHYEFQTGMPYAVCPTCQGRIPETCSHCKGRGMLSKFMWDRVPVELKAMRTKAIERARA